MAGTSDLVLEFGRVVEEFRGQPRSTIADHQLTDGECMLQTVSEQRLDTLRGTKYAKRFLRIALHARGSVRQGSWHPDGS